MMPRWLWWVPFGVVTLCCALFWFRMGWIAAFTTETDVINTYAARYLEDRAHDEIGQGAKPTDCVAYPGKTHGIWIVVSCGPSHFDARRHYEYYVNRFGGLEFSSSPLSEGVAPGSGASRPKI
ncbi:hypothetical protein [Roseobacter sp.]|uniref:hypothetical protein n=1 Tax=Roseobacter sp. TaxID=1907202 RepID=UPI0032977BC4